MKETFMEIRMNLKRRIITIAVMTLMIFGCSMLLGSKAYAVSAPKVSAMGGYESVTLTMEGDATSYDIYEGTTLLQAGVTAKTYKAHFDPFPADASGIARQPVYKVVAHGSDGSTAETTTAPVDVVHPMYVILQAKGKLKLYPSAKGKKAALTVPKGTRMVAYGGSRQDTRNKRMLVKFGPDQTTYYVKVDDVKKVKYIYNSAAMYTSEQVLAFVNDANVQPVQTGSKGKLYGMNMMWVNTYNQRWYLFTWDGTKWVFHPRYPMGLQCNTGRELTPFGLFKITSKWDVKRQTGTKWWCIFNGVGVHQQLGQKLGKPLSGGCIRIKTSEAKWCFHNIGKRTPILVY
jgi:lipoprotein-anchoring transpeptidase ErfK/SrfK